MCVCVYVCVCVCVCADRRLQSLGNVDRMSAERLPKMLLFGELRKKRPCHGTKKIWCHVIFRPLAWRGDGISGVRTDSSSVGHAGKELKP